MAIHKFIISQTTANGTAKSLNCFLTWEEKWSFVVFCWLAKFIVKRVCCVVLLMKVLTKMAARLLEVRRRLPVSFFFLFTWNLNFCKHFLLNLFVINKLRFLSQSFLVRKRWVHETASFTRIHCSCKQSIEPKTQLQEIEKSVLGRLLIALASILLGIVALKQKGIKKSVQVTLLQIKNPELFCSAIFLLSKNENSA